MQPVEDYFVDLFAQFTGRIDPLVIDLDGDGVNTTSVTTSGVTFDLDNNGTEEGVGWFEAEDGILVQDWKGAVDANGNRIGDGEAQDRSEVFATFDELSRHDLNGDGILDASDVGPEATQDTNGDGIIDADDVILPNQDNNGDGVIDVNDIDPRAQDTNNNGYIDAEEAIQPTFTADLDGDGTLDTVNIGYDQVHVWIDANTNGNVDAGELNSLSDLNIASIDLNETEIEVINNGNLINSESTVTLDDGSELTINGIDLFRDTINQSYEQQIDALNLSPAHLEQRLDVFTMPQLQGSGNVPHLMIAALGSDAILNAWRAVSTYDGDSFAEYRGLVEELVFEWSGANALGIEDRGGINPKVLNTIEAFLGTEYINPNDPAGTVRSEIIHGNDTLLTMEAFDGFIDNVALRMFVQSDVLQDPSNPIADTLSYDFATDTFEGDWTTAIDLLKAERDAVDVTAAEQNHIDKMLSTIYAAVTSGDNAVDVQAAVDIQQAYELNVPNPVQDFYDEFVVGYDDGTNDVIVVHYDNGGTTSTIVYVPPGNAYADGGANSVLSTDDVSTTNAPGKTSHNYENDAFLISVDDGNTTYNVEKLYEGALPSQTLIHHSNAFVEDGYLNLRDAEDMEFSAFGQNLIIHNTATGSSVMVDRQYFSTYGIDQIHLTGTLTAESKLVADLTTGTLNRADIERLAWIRGTDGNDHLIKTSQDYRTYFGKLGHDYLVGGNDDDTYIYRSGDGNDTIVDVDTYKGIDTLFLEDLSESDVQLIRSEDLLLVRIIATGQEIKVVDQFGNGESGLEQIIFNEEIVDPVDGSITNSQTTLTRSQIKAAAVYLGSDYTDALIARSEDETLIGNEGDDVLVGRLGDHKYIYASGDGNDVIYDVVEGGTRGFDILELTDLNRNQIEFRRTTEDLILIDLTTNDQILVQRQFSDGSLNSGIEQIVFADGETIDRSTIKSSSVYVGTSDSETIEGTSASEVFVGHGGDDNLVGKKGADTYYYRSGDGNDTIIDHHNSDFSPIDRLVFLDLVRDQVVLMKNGKNLIVLDELTQEKITLVGQFESEAIRYGVEELVFSDGGTLNRTEMRDQSVMLPDDTNAEIIGTENDDTLSGSGADQNIYGLGGNDTINAGNGRDAIIAGTGDDVVDGGDDSDLYVYNRGDGHDTYIDGDHSNGGTADTVLLNGISPADVVAQRDGNDIILSINESAAGANDGGSIRLSDSGNKYHDRGIEYVHFDDGTIWTQNDLRSQIFAAEATNGDDTISGYNANDTIDAGDGNDTINAYGWADTLTGGLGDDTIDGGEGSDAYIYNRGDGNDVYIDYDRFDSGTNDRVILHGISTGDVSVARSGNDFLLTIAESSAGANDGGSIRLSDSGNNYTERGIEYVHFDDGTIWDQNHIRSLIYASEITSGDDTISGYNANDTIDAGGGNDTIYAYGWADILTGGLGDDTIDGGEGSDSYIYNRGDGNDIYIDHDRFDSGTNDRVYLQGISTSDVTVSGSGNDFILSIAESSPSADDDGSIRMVDSFNNYNERGLEYVEFDDGTVWNRVDMRGFVHAGATTSGDDTITGSSSSETLYGGDGDDVISGAGGHDHLHGEDGNDQLNGGDDDDHIYGGNGNDNLSGGDDDDYLYGGDGDDYINGGSGDDHEYGGAGNDFMVANSGSDYFDGGDGIDTIDFEYTSNDVVIDIAQGTATFESGGVETMINFESVNAGRGDNTVYGSEDDNVINGGDGDDYLYGGDGNDIINGDDDDDFIYGEGGDDYLIGNFGQDLFDGGDGIDTLDFTYASSDIEIDLGQEEAIFTGGGIEQILNIENLIAGSGNNLISGSNEDNGLDGGDGNDTIYGLDGNDTLIGGTGDDTLDGGDGSDSYNYNRGDGNDLYQDTGIVGSTNDKLVFTDISHDQVSFFHEGDDILVKFPESSNGVYDNSILRLTGSYVAANSLGVDSVEFSDGVIYDRTQLQQMSDTYLGDEIFYFADDGTIQNIDGGDGNDTVSFQQFDHAVWVDFTYNGVDAWTRDASHVDSGTWREILDLQNIENITGSDYDDELFGNASNNILIGGLGEDEIAGGDGNDIVTGGAGADDLQGGAGDDVIAGGDGADDLQAGDGDDRVIIDEFDTSFSGDAGIDTVVYNGSANFSYDMDLGDFENAEFGSGNDTIYGTDGANDIHGGSGNDTLHGEDGDDRLEGGAGNDSILGGVGIDTAVFSGNRNEYTVSDTGDGGYIVQDNAQNQSDGTDTVYDAEFFEFADVTLAAGNVVGNLGPNNSPIARSDTATTNTIQGDYRANTVNTGNQTNDLIFGADGDDILAGGAGDDIVYGELGDDTLSGGIGDDYLIGGAGTDTFIFNAGDGQDTILDFDVGTQQSTAFADGDLIQIDINGVEDFDDLLTFGTDTQDGVSFDFGNGDLLLLAGTQLAALDRDAFSFF